MKFEPGFSDTAPNKKSLSESFKSLLTSPEGAPQVFQELEDVLSKANYSLANEAQVARVLKDNMLICRSEHFNRVVDMLETHTPLQINAREDKVNMCTMALGTGFRVAMMEGFSGKEVGGVVKVVVVFNGEHLDTRMSVPPGNDLWKTKPETAQVSLIGGGHVFPEDVEMISFRFPTHLFHEQHLSDSERDMLEEEGGHFIVRHYIPEKNKATQ